MKTTSSNISANIISLNSQNKEHLMGFKTDSDQQRKLNRSANNNLFGVVVQIKILTILPELIWSRIDKDDFFVATQLFIFSRHISTGLKLDANNDIMKKFPVAKKQWDLLAPFFYTIKQQCMSTLERENLSSETASKCLASLMLLENCQLEKLLTTFVQTRLKTFTGIIENDDYGLVKEKLLQSLKILMSTATIIHECFIGEAGRDGLLIQELKKISAENSDPTLKLLEHVNTPIFQTLPDIISKYRPQVFFNQLNKESLHSTIQSWLKSVENVSHNQLKALVQLIVSIKTIQDIQQQIRKTIEKPKNWSTMCKDLYLPENIDFFKEFYLSLINDRIESIINIFWSTILTELNEEVDKLITDNDKVHRDMKHYVWIEDSLDNPLSLKDALSPNKQSHRLLMKVKGFTTSIVDVCNKIDGNLELLFTDLKMYLGGISDVAELRRAKNVDPDHKKIVLFLRECSRENISSLITSIKSSKFNKTAENCIMIARLLQAISELCPNLRLCFSGDSLLEPSYLRDPTKDDDSEKEWNNICSLLEEESIRFWCLWLDIFINEWKTLDQSSDANMMLKDFPSWDSITIEEKDESDNVVQSQIYVPSQLSLSIQCWIYDIISSLNRVIPHTLPKIIHLQIIEKLVEKLHARYQALSVHEFTIGNQKAAWQFFLDVKVLMTLFVGRDNKVMTEKLQLLVNSFKSIIDPFDFDVFYQHVNGNIKRNVARMQHGFGCLVPNMEHLSSLLANQSMTSPHDKDPNVLTMSSNANSIGWFPLLPIITTKENAPAPAQETSKKEEKVRTC
jgi:conserved oligomeric Golgi complex subunit 1